MEERAHAEALVAKFGEVASAAGYCAGQVGIADTLPRAAAIAAILRVQQEDDESTTMKEG